MEGRTVINLVLILLLAAMAIYLVVPQQHSAWVTNLLFWRPEAARNLDFQLGLDLQGGLQVLLVAKPVEGQEFDAGAMDTARRIVENRVNALGLTEPVVQIQGTERIVVEIPGIEDPAQAVDTIRETALLEFVEPPAETPLELLVPGTLVRTTSGTAQTLPQPTDTLTESLVFETILTGADLKNAFPHSR